MYDKSKLQGADISMEYCGIPLQSPYILTSGPLTYAAEGMIRGHEAGCGAVVTKTIRLGRAINPVFHIGGIGPTSLINAEKWADSERELWYEREIPMTKKAGAVVIGSVGHTPDEARAIVEDVEKAGADMIELVSYAEETLLPMLDFTKEHVNIPVICKLSGNWPDPIGSARKCLEHGADAIAAIDSIGPALKIDINKRRPEMRGTNGVGWLSGEAIRPISLNINYEIAKQNPQLKDLYGSGGVMSAEDAMEYFMAGCNAVGVCTVGILRDIDYIEHMCYDLSKLIKKLGFNSLEEAIGVAQVNFPPTEYIGRLQFSYNADYAPCQDACPAGVNVPQYVEDVRRGNYTEAYNRVSLTNPFPAICGRVCDHPCESKCRRADTDESVDIRLLKRTAADKVYEKYADELPIPAVKKSNGKKVAVIGAGPGGLSAAYYLAKEGYKVKVFEALPKAGGMLAVGIPDYRLPADILAKEVSRIERMGVEIVTGTTVDSLDKLRCEGFERILIAVGAHGDSPLDITGADLCVSGVAFLRESNLGKAARLDGKKVAVIGGGNVAVDAARSALRLGAAEVSIVYRRSRDEMPAYKEEIAHAEEEGVKLCLLAAPESVEAGKLNYTPMKLGEADESGRRRPVPSGEAAVAMPADLVILAIGQKIVADFMPAIVQGQFESAEKGVYIAGDCLYGPASVIKAIASGRDAACEIDKSFGGEGALIDQDEKRELRLSPITNEHNPAKVSACLSACSRKESFDEVELGLAEDAARDEAERCLKCGCVNCGRCVAVCCYDARTLNFPVMEVDEKECRGCGMCVSVCPTGALTAMELPQNDEDKALYEESQEFYRKYFTAH